MLQGVGSRFDFHVCKTLCDLRYCYLSILQTESPYLTLNLHHYFRTKEMFDIVIDYPDSTPALHDLKVGQLNMSTRMTHSPIPRYM